jgi:hypothetical protein
LHAIHPSKPTRTGSVPFFIFMSSGTTAAAAGPRLNLFTNNPLTQLFTTTNNNPAPTTANNTMKPALMPEHTTVTKLRSDDNNDKEREWGSCDEESTDRLHAEKLRDELEELARYRDEDAMSSSAGGSKWLVDAKKPQQQQPAHRKNTAQTVREWGSFDEDSTDRLHRENKEQEAADDDDGKSVALSGGSVNNKNGQNVVVIKAQQSGRVGI